MRALISVSDKSGIVDFAKGIVALGYEIVSTGGTAKALEAAKIPVIPIDTVTGFPEMMDGRVKTLHPKIHAGLLAVRNNPRHIAECQAQDIALIDLVVVNLYPFEETISKPNIALAEAIENIDIGGPSMLRSASKNYASVGVITNPEDYSSILKELQENQGQLRSETRARLAQIAFSHTARYDSLISNYLLKQQPPSSDASDAFPDKLTPVLKKQSTLRYGENPHQGAAFYKIENQGGGLPDLIQHHGKALSFNNIVDLESAWHLVREFEQPAATVIKHTNPCGTAIADSLVSAYKKALEADPVSAFGSIVGLNRSVDLETAEGISKLFVEAVIAPSFDDDALQLLSQKQNIRLISLKTFHHPDQQYLFKYVQGGFLAQSPNQVVVKESLLSVATKKQPTPHEDLELGFAFTVVKHVKSNAIVIVKDGVAIGVGAGQMSRVEAVEIAIKRAGDNLKGAVAASDAFFPFKDSIELLATAGITAIIQPGGSKRDQEIIDACDTHGIAMVFTGIRHFKH